MTKEQFAAMLDDRQYGDEITTGECKLANEHGLLVVFGDSDDGVKMRGFYHYFFNAIKGGSWQFFLTDNNELVFAAQDSLFSSAIDRSKPLIIEANWCPDNLDTSWLIKANVDCATFDIFEDDELFCRGVVLDKKDIVKALLGEN
jgi:hypothetical protein